MKQVTLFVGCMICAFTSFSQSKLGLKFSPSISTNRVSLIDTIYDVEADGSAFKFSLGLIYDHELTDTYYFSTGLIFVPKQVAFSARVEEEYEETETYAGNPSESYQVNYLQVPISLKLFTNEIQPDTRVFFQVGIAPEILIFSTPEEEDYDLISEFRNLDASILLGAGVEYRAGINTMLFGGVTYQRGLGNTIKNKTIEFQDELFIRNTIVSLDVGIKF